ncbi:MAG: ammonium transporter [Gammaproteobacteria bacterium]|jgi:Amt family ammonium transporter|nr:ammonium transporter [Gammaproteobacteria bacterium]
MLTKLLNLKYLATLLLLMAPSVASAQDLSGGNTAWILTSTALVLFMTLPGLSLFYGGLVRTKNVLSVLMQCFAIAVVISILWLVVGYSIAFGPSESAYWGGLSKALFSGVNINSMSGDIPETVFASFQMTFAIITPALIVGAFVERIKFSAMLLFTSLWTLIVYFPIANWVWGGGWLGQMGLIDFAGGTVVHITAGVGALVTAIVIGPRKDFLSASTLPHNLTMSFTGAAMLWVGWFGFNAGSALAADGAAGMAMFVTHISAATGALTWMVIEWLKFGKPSGLGAITGMVAGLATITPASGSVGPAGALIVGLSGGVICYYATMYLKQTVKIDDSLDVFPVHGVGGMVGTFLAGILVSGNLGLFSGNGLPDGMTIGSQVGVQLTGIAATVIYTAIVTFVLLKVVGALTSGIRISEEQEQKGCDISDHDEQGYSM